MVRRSTNPQPGLGAAIRLLRGKKGITQEALAQGAEITVAHLSAIERGHANPTWGTVEAIASALGSSMGEIGKLADRSRPETQG